MKLHNISPTDLKYKYKEKIKTVLPGSFREIPNKAKKLIFWYDEFQKHTIDLENIQHSNLLSGVEHIAIMDVLRIEMTNSLTGFYHDPKSFTWRYVAPTGISQAIVNPAFEISGGSGVKAKKTVEVDEQKYNSKLDDITDPEISNIYWILLIVLFLIVISVLVIPLLVLR